MDAAVRRKETESEDCESHQLLGWTRRCVQAVFERAWARMKYAIVIDRGQWKWLTKTAELSITATALENGADFRLSHASHRTTRSFIRSRTHIHTPHEFLSWIPRKCAFRCAPSIYSAREIACSRSQHTGWEQLFGNASNANTFSWEPIIPANGTENHFFPHECLAQRKFLPKKESISFHFIRCVVCVDDTLCVIRSE